MNGKNILNEIVDELHQTVQKISESELENFSEKILNANRIFVAGAGRSGCVARAFSNRLMHLGLDVSFVGEPTTPAIKSGDILLISSGSGETESLVAMAQKAKKFGASIGTVTIHPEASIGSLSDFNIYIPGSTPKSKFQDTVKSVQPMGNLFEQMSWLVYDTVVMILMKKINKTEEEMFQLHANLE